MTLCNDVLLTMTSQHFSAAAACATAGGAPRGAGGNATANPAERPLHPHSSRCADDVIHIVLKVQS